MKLGGISGRKVYCTRGYTAGVWTGNEGFVGRGRLPNPETGLSRVSFGILNGRLTKRLLRPVVGAWTTTNIWPLDAGIVLATVGPQVFRSGDGGRTWTPVARLPSCSGPMGVLPTSVCEHKGTYYLAEYPLGDVPARIRASSDGGRTWESVVESRDVRHFHGVHRDPYREELWVTAGDTDQQSAIGRLRDGQFEPVGAGSQRWRAVDLAFTPTAVLWGMDCSYAREVELLRLDRNGAGEPVTVGTTDASVYYAETLSDGRETWVVLSTAAEVGVDSTAPPGRRHNESSDVARVLVSSSTTGFEEWHELAAFERRRTLGTHVSVVPTASAYVFLAADPSVGLVLNPFNTQTHHGDLLQVSLDRLRSLTAA
ncbi:glycosyl hydrolase [Halobellus ordinarius]|uniref:glycosyl hydrolase n=1 Tax=Halobellus ordinarius TaxID=3075120 RepID=UPI0028808EF6|nr:glycosyl hydrolase [Halobellus sp. ZY16]